MRAFRELEPPSADEGWTTVEQIPFIRTPSAQAPVGCLRRGGGVEAAGMGACDRRRGSRRTPPRIRLERGRKRRRPGRARPAARDRDPRAGRERPVPARRRPARLLVSPSAARLAARVRASSRCRAVALGPRRRLARAQDARKRPRRALRSGLSVGFRRNRARCKSLAGSALRERGRGSDRWDPARLSAQDDPSGWVECRRRAAECALASTG